MENNKDAVSILNEIMILQNKKVDYQCISNMTMHDIHPPVFMFSAISDEFKGISLKH